MIYFKDYHTDEEKLEATKIAIRNRLYVNGWLLREYLETALKNPNSVRQISIAWDCGVPVAIMFQKKFGMVSFYVKLAYRRNGIGTMLSSRIMDTSNISAKLGLPVVSELFFKKINVPTTL